MSWQEAAKGAIKAVPGVVQWLAQGVVLGIGALVAAAFVLWDTDLNDARGRYERAMLALFGTWDAERGVAVSDVGTKFEERIVGGLKFVSGWNRSRSPHYRWCYLSNARDGKAARVITLASVEGSEAVRWHTVSEADAAVFGMDVVHLKVAALRGCVLS